MSVFFTDTDCELWWTDVEDLGINIIKMPYTIDGEEHFYDMGKETDFDKFYSRIKQGAMPITSALNPQDYIDYFEPVFQKGEDVFYVHFSDNLSGTFKHMQVAINELKEKYPERKVITFNTKSICVGAGMSVYYAAKMHKEGKSDEEILKFLESFAPKVATYFVVDSLAHLRRGGRISALSATMGSLLNIKPILRVSADGKIEKYSTGKGMRKALHSMVELMKEKFEPGYPVYILDAVNKECADYVEEEIKQNFANVEIKRLPIGPVIGTHCGPGTVGIIFYAKER